MNKDQKLSELINNKTFCSMAWNHQFLDPTGRVKPCCRFQEISRPPENNLYEQSLKGIFYGPWMSDVREKMLKGEAVEGCRRCYQEEAAGKKSLRQRYHDNRVLPIEELVDISQPKIRWLELALSNQCNLACRMCDSRYSWKWFDEEKELFDSTYSSVKKAVTKVEEIFPFLEDIVHIKFTGGEPLITKEHWDIVNRLAEMRDCKDIYLNYSTNCTIKPRQEWTDLWDKFSLVEFALSFDSATKAESEYIRWPAKQEVIEETTKKFISLTEKENYVAILRTTVSILNIWSLPETILWWIENGGDIRRINPTHLTYPAILSVTILPKGIKDKISEKFKEYLVGDYPEELKKPLSYMERYMHSKDDTHMLGDLKEYVMKTDEYRKQNFFEYYSYFKDIFEGVALKGEMHEP